MSMFYVDACENLHVPALADCSLHPNQQHQDLLLTSGSALTGNQWRKHAPVQILALVAEYRERMEEQVVVLFQVLAAEINFGYKFQTVRPFSNPGLALAFYLPLLASPASD